MNRVFLIGNLTRDPESNQTQSGISVCKFSIAVNRRFGSSDGNKGVDYFPIVCWRGQADNCAKYLKKGSKVCVVGSVQIREYETQAGEKRKDVEVQADEVQFLSTKNEGAAISGGGFDEIETLPEINQGAKKIEKAQAVIDGDDLPF